MEELGSAVSVSTGEVGAADCPTVVVTVTVADASSVPLVERSHPVRHSTDGEYDDGGFHGGGRPFHVSAIAPRYRFFDDEAALYRGLVPGHARRCTAVQARRCGREDEKADSVAELRGDLEQIVGGTHVLTDPDVVAGYVTDWTGNWHGHTAAVVRPANTDEVSPGARTLSPRRCGSGPQGGNTGLVGGSLPLHGEVVLSTARLNRIEEVDALGCTLAAGAGVRVADAQRAAAGHGLALGVDLASRESATLGGIVATNAGGIAFVKHGNTRAQVLGLEAVLADGRVLTRWAALTQRQHRLRPARSAHRLGGDARGDHPSVVATGVSGAGHGDGVGRS